MTKERITLETIKPAKPDPKKQRKPAKNHPWKSYWNNRKAKENVAKI